MSDAAREGPAFDDTRKALAFALNAHRAGAPPRAGSSIAMALLGGEVEKAKAKRKARRKQKAESAEEALERQEREDAERRALVRAAFARRQPKTAERDRALQAGIILAEFARLDASHRDVLEARLVVSHEPCACRRPCCSGWAVSLRWRLAVDRICETLKERADLMKSPGKRGMSTLPELRRAVVEAHVRGRAFSTSGLADEAGVSALTAARHRAVIVEWLEATEDEAWHQAALLLDRAGITGAFTD